MNVLDLFCGAAGGWSLGLHRAGFRTVAGCEIDEWRRAAFGRNFPGVRLYPDVRELTAARIVADLGYFPECVVGSPPCQDASAANTKGTGIDGPQTGLFMEAIRLIGEGRPAWACFENSPRLRTRGVDRVLAELEALGYACWPLVVGADDVGAPHIRKRMWLIAADAERTGIRQQPGRGNGEDGACEAELAHDSVANCDGQPRIAKYGEVEGALGIHRDADGHGWTGGRSGRRERGDVSAAQDAGDHDCARLEERKSLGSDAFPQLAALERAVGAKGYQWNGGPERHLRLVNGLSTGLARKCVAAYGDALLPQIAELIGRAIMATEHMGRAG